jgi:hypothetical protein
MASAHGAGLMLIPVLLGISSARAAHDAHADHVSTTGSTTVLADLAVIGIHTLAMFAMMSLVAIVVYEKVGAAILKRSWFDLDRPSAVEATLPWISAQPGLANAHLADRPVSCSARMLGVFPWGMPQCSSRWISNTPATWQWRHNRVA